ncbi:MULTISPECIES: hypothetical protein [unclassified Dehalobacter]|uniref:hypothetical protein n=1 Tax=unclassified Dehalobacter TaxID=2635733 RepID=UPI001FA9F927|nr:MULTISPECIES: hypothetical protein [unclassified Dehalobacter]
MPANHQKKHPHQPNQHNHSSQHQQSCSCGHDHSHQSGHAVHVHDAESCPVCSGVETITPEEYLNKIEEAVNKLPLNKTTDRMNRLIVLTAGTAASAAEHKDMILLQITEVYLTLRLAEESGQTLAPENAQRLFRELSGQAGLALTAKYGLEGLTKVGLNTDTRSTPGTASLVFISCYAVGKVLMQYFRKQAEDSTLTVEEIKDCFRVAKAEAERLARE